MEAIINKTAEHIRSHNMINAQERVIVGVSGGADSLGLLILLLGIKNEGLLGFDFDLLPCHVNHHIRGEAADRDEELSRDICKKLGLPFFSRHVDVPGEKSMSGETMEEAARRLRYSAFVSLAKEEKATVVALAHHMNDQAETLLFNLIRGTGLKGMAGIAPVGRLPFDEDAGLRAIRPLLFLKKSEIEDYLKTRGISWCEDETNADAAYSRNRIRHNILPEAEKINERAVDHMARLARDMAKTDSYIEEQTDKAFLRYVDGDAIDIALFEKEHEVIYTQVIRRCIKTAAGRLKDITAVHVTDVAALAAPGRSGSSIDLPYGVRVRREYDRLVFKTGTDEQEPEYESSQRIIRGAEVIRDDKGAPAFPKDSCIKWFDCDKINGHTNGGRICVRHPEQGDIISTGNGRKKLEKLFKDEKIPLSERKNAVVFGFEGCSEVLWVYAPPVSRVAPEYLTDADTKAVFEIRLQGGRL